MANYAKYSKSAMGHMLKHFERARDENGSYIKFGNIDIDAKKTRYNYNLAPEHNQLEFIHNRISEVYCFNRKDVIFLCSWIVTKPNDLPQRQEKKFFKEVYGFLEEKYGRENVVSAYVHKDEKTPHLHFAFVPVVPDPKRGGYKVSAKECVTRYDLEIFHEQLQRHLDEKKVLCSVINEATKEGNQAIKELKQGTAKQELETLKKEVQALKAEKEALELEIEVLKEKRNKLK